MPSRGTGLGGMLAAGAAFGAGSAVAHHAVGSMMGGGRGSEVGGAPIGAGGGGEYAGPQQYQSQEVSPYGTYPSDLSSY